MSTKCIKCLLVGDDDVGKASLITTYSENSFLERAEQPKSSRQIHTKVPYERQLVPLQLCNVIEGEEDETLKALSNSDTADVILLCFSLVSPQSLQNIQDKWNKEVSEACPNLPKVLVGTKLDLRITIEGKRTSKAAAPIAREHYDSFIGGLQDGYEIGYISSEDGKTVADAIGAKAYVECSSLNHEGIWETFDEAVRIVAAEGKITTNQKSGCVLI